MSVLTFAVIFLEKADCGCLQLSNFIRLLRARSGSFDSVHIAVGRKQVSVCMSSVAPNQRSNSILFRDPSPFKAKFFHFFNVQKSVSEAKMEVGYSYIASFCSISIFMR